MTRKPYMEVAKDLIETRFTAARCAFVAGSITRGEETATSDIDLVVVFGHDDLPKAYRDSAVIQDWPVEMFVQNGNSLRYFWDKDAKSGCPALVNMVAEGVIVGTDTTYAADLKNMAQRLMDKGPPALSKADMDKHRYMITDHLDDLSGFRNYAELYGTLGALYQALGDFYLRANNRWSGKAKSLPRAFKRSFPELLMEYEAAFKAGFNGDVSKVIEIADRLLLPFGGRNWSGWRLDAPDEANLAYEPEKGSKA